MNHGDAARMFGDAWRTVYGKPPNLSQLLIVQSMSLFEGGYGENFHWNMGAHQSKEHPPCTYPDFEWTDSRPPKPGEENDPRRDPKRGGNIPFQVCMLGFSTPTAGAIDYVRLFGPNVRKKTWRVLHTPGFTVHDVSQALREENYYWGFGETLDEQVDGYVHAINLAKKTIVKANGWKDPFQRKVSSSGSGGAAVGVGLVLGVGLLAVIARQR